jgi:hypothetical protein
LPEAPHADPARQAPRRAQGAKGERSPIARALWLALAACAVGVGTWARVQILDGRQWTTDEYYFLRSVGFVLDAGIPEFPTGGYYVRGLGLQYLTAALWSLTGESTAAARSLSMLFGLGSIALGYVYARRYVSWAGAVAVAVMLALSSWQIEFSGFARMYSALQFMTLAFLISLDRAFPSAGPERWAPHLVLLAVALVHEQVVLLAPLVLMPLLSGRSPRPWLELAVGLAVIAAVAGFVQFDFRHYGVEDLVPRDFDWDAIPTASAGHDISGYLVWVPAFPFWSVSDDPFVNTLFAAAVLGAAGMPWLALYLRGRVQVAHLWAIWLLVGALLHQFAIAAIAGAVLLLRYDLLDLPRGTRAPRRLLFVIVGAGVVAAAGWLAYAFADAAGWMAAVYPGDLPRTLRLTFLALPNFLDPIFFPWREALPRLGAAFALAFAALAWLRRHEPIAELARGPLAVIAVSFAILALVETPQLTTRYCFYLYPVLLVMLMQALERLAEHARVLLRAPVLTGSASAACALGLFAVGGDFHPQHIASIAGPEASYRIGPWQRYEDLWYQRIDFRGPSEFLNREIPPERAEPVLIVGLDPVAQWLERPYGFYFRPNSLGFLSLGRNGGTTHIWTGRPIVSGAEQVRAFSAGAQTAWIVRFAGADRETFDAAELFGPRFVAEQRAYLGEDGRLEVVRVSLAPESDAS